LRHSHTSRSSQLNEEAKLNIKDEVKDDYSPKPKYPNEYPRIRGRAERSYQDNYSKDDVNSNTDQASDAKRYDKKKGKRRSKKDQVGRDFACNSCDKTYLSYPALYTHKKIKHCDKLSNSSGPHRRVIKEVKPYNSEKNPT